MTEKWKVFCMTFNVNGKRAATEPVEGLLNDEGFAVADIVVIGLQVLHFAGFD